MEAFLVGRCGKTEREAGLTTTREYLLLRKGADEAARERWEIARWQAWQRMLLSPDIKPHNKPNNPKAFMRFPWEEPEAEEVLRMAKGSRVSEDEAKELNRIFTQLHKDKS